MTIGDRCLGGFEIGEVFGAVDLAGLDPRGDTTPGNATFVVTREEGILAISSDWADQVFDAVAVDLDAAIGQEGLQPVPVV
jgi:hypothetical protein